MITRSSIKDQIHTFACGNTAFDPKGANTALFVASANSKEVQTSDIATSNFVKFARHTIRVLSLHLAIIL